MNGGFSSENKIHNMQQQNNNKSMIINILKSIRTVLILFATIFVINKSLIYLEIKTIEYIKIPILLYLLIFIVSFLNLQSKEKKNRPQNQ